MHTILESIDDLLHHLPENYTEKEQQAFLTACLTIKKIILESLSPVSIRRNEARSIRIRVDIDGRMALRRRSDKRHPIRLVVSYNRKIKRYALRKFGAHLSSGPETFYFYKQEWKDLWAGENNPIKQDLENLEQIVAGIVKEHVQPFSFSKFEKKMGF